MTLSDSVKQKHVQDIDVILVSMPFGVLTQPSIGLGLLQAHLKSFGVSSKILNFTLTFAQIIGISLYNSMTEGEPAIVDLLGEWLFSAALFQNDHDDLNTYIDNILLGGNPDHRSTNPAREKVISQEFISDILQARTKISSFLDACTRQVLHYRPKIVGFTSLFHQHLASLALAQRLKSTNSDIKILFGGANCEGAMGAELVRQFRFVDAVVSGEADLILRELIERLLANQSVSYIQGVYTYDNVDLVAVNGMYLNAPSVTDMDALPYPDYTDYFEQKRESGLDFPANVLFETSRGCWWGHLKHCTFCGLNSLTMMFRSKSPERALVELLYLRDTYPGSPIVLVDNILDMKYFQTFVPRLAAMELDLKLFYEVKANMKKQQVQLLKSAGITTIQPGIESFSTDILELMSKGVRALQNIQLLKWCREFDIQPLWNFLWGFPNEDPAEYARMAEMIPLLVHLPPPAFSQRIHLDRFSPLFSYPENYGLTNVRPHPSYFYIYPSLSASSIANIAYYFTCDYKDGRNVRDYVVSCAQRIEEWKRSYATSALYTVPIDGDLLIWDFRPVAKALLTRLAGLEREVYLACDTIQSLDTLRALIARYRGPVSHQEVRDMLQRFIERNLMLVEGNAYLSLAVLLTDHAPRRAVFDTMLRAMEMGRKMPGHFSIVEYEVDLSL